MEIPRSIARKGNKQSNYTWGKEPRSNKNNGTWETPQSNTVEGDRNAEHERAGPHQRQQVTTTHTRRFKIQTKNANRNKNHDGIHIGKTTISRACECAVASTRLRLEFETSTSKWGGVAGGIHTTHTNLKWNGEDPYLRHHRGSPCFQPLPLMSRPNSEPAY